MLKPILTALLGAGTLTLSATLPLSASAEIFVEAEAPGFGFVHVNGMTGEYQFPEMTGQGGALFDFDNDGDLDVYLIQGGLLDADKKPSDLLFPVPAGTELGDRLLRNELISSGSRQELRFTDVTAKAGIDARGYGMGVATGDFDNDGWTDLYVTNFGSNQLLRNRGNGTFEDVTAKARVQGGGWSTSAAFVDFDRDGWLDLFVARYVEYSVAKNIECYARSSRRDYCGPSGFAGLPDLLLRNRGDGTFEDVTAKAGIAKAAGAGLGVTAADFNGDRWPDLYVANDGEANRLWLNRKDGTFFDDALLAGAAVNRQGQPEASMGVTAGDFDSDGDEDLFMTHLTGESNTLYVNDGGALFSDRSVETSLAAGSLPFTAFGTAWLDFDLDGRLDLVVLNGAVKVLEPLARAGDLYPLDQTNQLFRNLGRGFAEVTAQAGAAFERAEVSRGVAVGDVDNDGDPDLLVLNNNGPARLLLNGARGGISWIGLRLVDPKSGRDLLGARVALLRSGAPDLWRRAHTDGSYCSASDPRVLFGLAAGDRIRGVRVIWPDGSEETFPAPAKGRYSKLTRGEGKPASQAAAAVLPLGSSPFRLAAVVTAAFALGAAPPAAADGLEAIPYPPLEAFEKDVRVHIQRTQELLQETLETKDAPGAPAPAELGDLFGEVGMVYHAYELAEPALACYRNALSLDPGDRRWPYYRSLLLQGEGRLEEAAEGFRGIIAQEPGNISARIYLAEILAEMNRSEEAEAILRAVLEDLPKSTAARALLGTLAQAAGRNEEAVELLEQSLAEIPEANRLHYSLAQAYRGLGNLDKAREHLALHGPVGLRPPDPMVEALVDIPQGERVHLLQGRLAFQAGRYGEAADAFEDAVNARPESARARTNLATALGQTGATYRAMEQYRKALELEPGNGTAHFNLGVLHARRGELAEAREHLQAAVEADSQDSGARRELAIVEERAGRPEAALDLYAEARRLAPLDEAAWFGEASLLVDLGRYGKALKTLEDAVGHLPDQGRLLHGLARLLAAAPDESLRDGERALALATNVFNARRTLAHGETVAMAMAELGRCKDAADWQRRLVEEAERTGADQQLESLRNALALYEQGDNCRYRPTGTGTISVPGDGVPTP